MFSSTLARRVKAFKSRLVHTNTSLARPRLYKYQKRLSSPSLIHWFSLGFQSLDLTAQAVLQTIALRPFAFGLAL